MVRETCHREVWISYEEASLISGLSKKSLQNLKSEGRIRGARAGKFRVHHESLLKYLGRA